MPSARLRRSVVAPWLCLVFTFAVAADSVAAPSAALAALAERYHEAQVRFDPVRFATERGDHRFDDRLPIGIAPAHRRQRFAAYRQFLRQLAAIDRARLDSADALTHELLAAELRTQLGFERFADHLLPLHQMGSIPVKLARFGSGQMEQPLGTAAQLDAYLRRIERLPAWTEQAIVNLREGVRRGIVPPRAVTEAALAQLLPLGSGTLAENPFCAPVRNLPAGLADADRRRLTRSFGVAVTQRIAPAIRRLVHFVRTEYLPAGRDSAGWGAHPDGAAWYRQWVREHTTTELDPHQIHALGVREVARVHEALAGLAPRLGYEGDARKLLGWLRARPDFQPYRSELEVLDRFRALHQQVDARLARLFGRLPKAALEIRPVPALLRAGAYTLPAADGSGPGIFWAVIRDPAKVDATNLTRLFLHEGAPGHHVQMALQQELPLPKFRRRAWINAYNESWALYAETLGFDLGLYDDPVSHAGFLRQEMVRAARLVVDTGIHALGWSGEEAVAYWIDHVGTGEAEARAEILRWMAWPGHALSYMIGTLKFQELRERARHRLGTRFDLAAFHDALLADGALPLPLLDRRIDRWIDAQP